MAGMMTQALEGQQQPSPGPGMQTPPPGSPAGGAGQVPGQPQQQPPQEAAPEEEEKSSRPQHKAQVPYQQLQDEAIQIVYGDRFDQLINMFQKNGPNRFARSCAITFNSAIDQLEQRHGQIGPENTAKVGMALYVRVLEDMLTGENPPVPEVPVEQIAEVLPATLFMYQENRDDVSVEDVKSIMVRVMEQGDPDMQEPDITGVVPGEGEPPPEEAEMTPEEM